MTETMPLVFMALCATALVAAVFLFSRSFAAVFGDASVDDSLPRVLPEDQQSLLDEKRALLVALRDLENERQLGKVSEDDYKRLEAQYRGRARRVLQQLDGSVAPFREDAERLITDHLAKHGVTPETPAASTTETETASVSAPTPTSTADVVNATNEKADPHACSSCATVNDEDAAFCKKCGTRMEPPGA